jgi:hypothetical protein
VIVWFGAGAATAVNDACCPASGGFGAIEMDVIVGAGTTETVTICWRVVVAPPASVTARVTV